MFFSIFGYLQDEHYGKIYHAFLSPTNAKLSGMELLSFVPGCHNDCPRFSSFYDPYGEFVYFKVSTDQKPGNVEAFAINNIKSMPIKFPPNVTTMSFYGNGTAYYLKDNSNSTSNSYAIYQWNAYTNASTIQRSVTNIANRFYRSCLVGSTLYALDRDKAQLIIWESASIFLTLKLNQNNLWVNNIESLNYGYEGEERKTFFLYALDRNGTIWNINVILGFCVAINNPAFSASIHSTNSANQLVIDSREQKYFVGFDKSTNAYRLATVDKYGYTVLVDLENTINGLQWIGLTQTYLKV